MPDLLQWLSLHLVRLGPGVLFAVCLLETAVFAGLILPVGALLAFAVMLSTRGYFDPGEVIFVALLGALLGDQLGFVVGRWFVPGARPARGGIARIWAAALQRTETLVRRRGLLGVSVARATPFVRTMMPWFAGRSGMPWIRFLVFDMLGVLLWGAIYIGGGYLAGQGWREVAARFGESAGALAVLALVLAFLLLTRGWVQRLFRRRRRRGRPRT
jgi:membrane-associated protein